MLEVKPRGVSGVAHALMAECEKSRIFLVASRALQAWCRQHCGGQSSAELSVREERETKRAPVCANPQY